MRLDEIATKGDVADLVAQITELHKEVAYLKRGLTAWIKTDEAERITGLSRKALDARRNNGTWTVGNDWKKEGALVLYNRSSLEAYNDSHKARRRRIAA